MLCIGLTGGIGSGKSTVAAIFEVLNIPVLYADDVAKKLMNTDPTIKDSIKKLFGPASYQGDLLNREYISQQVFTDEKKVNELNAIVHPATINYSKKWVEEQNAPYVIKEAALLFESKSNVQSDHVIGVKSSLETRIARTIARSGISRDQVLNRIANQMDEEKKISLCDFIISNEENEMLIPQVLALHQKFLNLSS